MKIKNINDVKIEIEEEELDSAIVLDDFMTKLTTFADTRQNENCYVCFKDSEEGGYKTSERTFFPEELERIALFIQFLNSDLELGFIDKDDYEAYIEYEEM